MTMSRQSFLSDGVEIAFIDEGEGEPILLIHGFGSNIDVNWSTTSWLQTLRRAGRRAVAFDNRGHGASQKLYEPAAYHPAEMAKDAANLLAHLGIGRADVMGYSMGARIATFLTLARPDLVRGLVIGGLGMAMVDGMSDQDEIVAALEAPGLDDVRGETGRIYRKFADQTGADRKALVACMRGNRVTVSKDQLAAIGTPTLVAVGSKDKVAGSGAALARLIPGAEFLEIPGREHLPATGDRVFKEGALEFLGRRA
jgi:pimeloyl-ACP methyl ester carboxylesterase